MTRQPFSRVLGPAAALLRANIDTDVIIRIEHLRQPTRSGLGRYAFEAFRYRSDGSEDDSFVFNRPAFRGAPILLAGANFGCGSSREHAVWALLGMGLRCVIAPSFGDIFYANCFQNGLLPISLPLNLVERLAEQCGTGASLTVDLQNNSITAPDGESTPFSIDACRRVLLLQGLDDIGLTVRDEATIRSWQAEDRLNRPWAWP